MHSPFAGEGVETERTDARLPEISPVALAESTTATSAGRRTTLRSAHVEALGDELADSLQRLVVELEEFDSHAGIEVGDASRIHAHDLAVAGKDL